MKECTISFLEEFRFNKRRLQSIGCRLGLPTYHLWPTGVIPSLLHKTQDLFPHQPILHSQTFPVALSHTSNPVLATLNYYQQAVEDTRSQKFVLFCLAGCPFLPRLLTSWLAHFEFTDLNYVAHSMNHPVCSYREYQFVLQTVQQSHHRKTWGRKFHRPSPAHQAGSVSSLRW